GPDALVYEQFGGIYIFNPSSGKSAKVDVRIAGDLPSTRPHYEKVADRIQNAGISPSGARAVFEARGEIFTVPADKGDARNLTHTPRVAERDPAWSPDGKSIAFFSDESGEYELHIVDQSGLGAGKKINLGNPPSFFYAPLWSPDSKKIAYTDKRLNLWYVDLEKGMPVKVTTDRFDDPTSTMNESWSPDSKWLTYSKFLGNHLRTVFVYSLDAGKESQITDGISDARYPVFDKGGKWLLFAASTDVGLSSGWLDLSSFQHPILRNIYAAALKKGDPSPVEPQSDEEKTAEEKKDAGGDKAKEADQRKAGEKGKEGEKKKEEPGKVVIDLDGMETYVDPREEWNQMYHEVWRIERDFLYDPNLHGLNLAATEKKYSVYLKGLGGRADLNYLFDEMLGEITIGHMFIAGGDTPKPNQVRGGLLGADYKIENGRYRFARIYNGENWNPELHAPLTQPGVDVKVGDYLLEVEGRDVRPPAEVYSFFENTAGKQIKIRVGPSPDGQDSRQVTVVPLGSEFALRNRAWEEDNRRKVDELSGGKLAYVHVPDTAVGGWLNFNRFYFAQVDKQGAVIDERYNHGGEVADYIIDMLKRPLRNCAVSREGEKFCSPLAQIYGPKTMIINEMSGSGGDALPWMFRQDKVGPVVGTRTWGGLVGIYG